MSIQPNPPPRTEPESDSFLSIMGAIFLGVAAVFGFAYCGQAKGCVGIGCVPTQTEATVANVVAVAANETLPVLVTAWSQEAMACVNDAGTREQADTCIAGVDRAWLPVWSSYDAFRGAHDLYRTEVAAGKVPSLTDLRPTYCALRTAVASKYSLPDFVPSCAVIVDAGADAAKDAKP